MMPWRPAELAIDSCLRRASVSDSILISTPNRPPPKTPEREDHFWPDRVRSQRAALAHCDLVTTWICTTSAPSAPYSKRASREAMQYMPLTVSGTIGRVAH